MTTTQDRGTDQVSRPNLAYISHQVIFTFILFPMFNEEKRYLKVKMTRGLASFSESECSRWRRRQLRFASRTSRIYVVGQSSAGEGRGERGEGRGERGEGRGERREGRGERGEGRGERGEGRGERGEGRGERREERGEGEGKKTRGAGYNSGLDFAGKRLDGWTSACTSRHSRYDLSIGDVYETSNYFASVEGEGKERRNTRE